MKVVNKENEKQKDKFNRFRNEIAIMTTLTEFPYPNINILYHYNLNCIYPN